MDATISEGWLDLKVKNETADTFQLRLSFDPEHLTGRLLSSAEPEAVYRVVNGAVTYWRRDGAVYEGGGGAGKISRRGGDEAAESQLLYRNVCRIGYPLPEGIPVIEEGERSPVMNRKAIAVLFGGCSPEYPVSLESACAVIGGMDRKSIVRCRWVSPAPGNGSFSAGRMRRSGMTPGTRRRTASLLSCLPTGGTNGCCCFGKRGVESMELDAVFPVLHGQNGEDGTVQGLIELAGIPWWAAGLWPPPCAWTRTGPIGWPPPRVSVPRSALIEAGTEGKRWKLWRRRSVIRCLSSRCGPVPLSA